MWKSFPHCKNGIKPCKIMNLDTFEEVKEKVLASPIVQYQGEITQKVKLHLLKEIEDCMTNHKCSLMIKKRVFIIAEELLNNLIR